MHRRVLFIPVVILAAGCAGTKIPLVRVWEPKKLLQTVVDCTEVKVQASSRIKAPLAPPGFVFIDAQKDRVLIRLVTPYDTETMRALYRQVYRDRRVLFLDPNEPKPLERDTGGRG